MSVVEFETGRVRVDKVSNLRVGKVWFKTMLGAPPIPSSSEKDRGKSGLGCCENQGASGGVIIFSSIEVTLVTSCVAGVSFNALVS